LPLIFRTVFVLREVEEMTVEQTAECLSIPAATVRSRMHRARGCVNLSPLRWIQSPGVYSHSAGLDAIAS
jgi:RNA polymerase sigma-70 factor (ECF subfamily)